MTDSFNYLKQWRMKMALKLKKKLSQDKASELLGYSFSYYSKMESGEEKISDSVKKNAQRVLTGN